MIHALILLYGCIAGVVFWDMLWKLDEGSPLAIFGIVSLALVWPLAFLAVGTWVLIEKVTDTYSRKK